MDFCATENLIIYSNNDKLRWKQHALSNLVREQKWDFHAPKWISLNSFIFTDVHFIAPLQFFQPQICFGPSILILGL